MSNLLLNRLTTTMISPTRTTRCCSQLVDGQEGKKASAILVKENDGQISLPYPELGGHAVELDFPLALKEATQRNRNPAVVEGGREGPRGPLEQRRWRPI